MDKSIDYRTICNEAITPITIVGGGPVGLLLALKLASNGINVTLFAVDNPTANFDARLLALSLSSVNELKQIGIDWLGDVANATAINQVHISHNGFGVMIINHQELGLPYLGFSIRYSKLLLMLRDLVDKNPYITLIPSYVKNVCTHDNYAQINYNMNNHDIALRTELLVIADGGKTEVAGLDYETIEYNQQALITTLKPVCNYNNTAFEHFVDDTTLAFIPNNDRYTMIWSLPQNTVKTLMDKGELIRHLNKLGFIRRFKGFRLPDSIVTYPLRCKSVNSRNLKHIVLIGNAAQVVHPISAQGLNLGIRDVRDLANCIIEADPKLLSNLNLEQYNRLRSKDSTFTTKFTHFAVKFLASNPKLVNKSLAVGLTGLNCLPFVKNSLAKTLIFGV